MKSYLNKQEKDQVLTMASFIAFFEELAEKWEKLERDSGPIGDMRRARSYTQRVLDYLFKEIDQDLRKKIIGQIKKMELVVKYRSQAAREYEKMQKLEEVTPVETDDLFDISNIALNYCIKECTKTGKEARECINRHLFLKYDIPVLNEDPPAGKCAYQLKDPEELKDWEPKEG